MKSGIFVLLLLLLLVSVSAVADVPGASNDFAIEVAIVPVQESGLPLVTGTGETKIINEENLLFPIEIPGGDQQLAGYI